MHLLHGSIQLALELLIAALQGRALSLKKDRDKEGK